MINLVYHTVLSSHKLDIDGINLKMINQLGFITFISSLNLEMLKFI